MSQSGLPVRIKALLVGEDMPADALTADPVSLRLAKA